MTRTRLALALLAALAAPGALTGCDGLAPGLMVPLTAGKITNVVIDIDPSKGTVAVGETITLGVRTNLGAGGLSYSWSATGGNLSATYGQYVTWSATGPGRAVITCTVQSADSSGSAQVAFTAR